MNIIPKIYCPLCRRVSMQEIDSEDKLLMCYYDNQEIVWIGDYP